MTLSGFEPLDPAAWDALRDVSAGQVVRIHRRRYMVTKKTTTAVAVRRWFWWEEIWKRLLAR